MLIIKDLKTGKECVELFSKRLEILDAKDVRTQNIETQNPSPEYLARVTLAETIAYAVMHREDLPDGEGSQGAKILMVGLEAIDLLANYIRGNKGGGSTLR